MVLELGGLGKYQVLDNGQLLVVWEKYKHLGIKESVFLASLHQMFPISRPDLYKAFASDLLQHLRGIWNQYSSYGGYVFRYTVGSIEVNFLFTGLTLMNLQEISVGLYNYSGKPLGKDDCRRFLGKIKSDSDVNWNSFIGSEYSYDTLLKWSEEFFKKLSL